jgi:hypothetical protein
VTTMTPLDAEQMTVEEVEQGVIAFAGLTGQSAEDVRVSTLGEVQLQLQGWKEAAAGHVPTALERFEAWLALAAKVLGPVATILGAVTGGVGLVSAAKAV